MRKLHDEDLAGIHEIAEALGISKQRLVNWRERSGDFPAPVKEFKMGPMYSLSVVRAWARAKGLL